MADRRDPGKVNNGLPGSGLDIPTAKKNKKALPPISVYLDESTREDIERLVGRLGIPRHALMQYAIKYFLHAYKQDPGILQVQEQTKKTIKKL